MTAATTPAVQTPAPADHPSVAAPKCIDCKHHRLRQRDKAWQARDLCAHPSYGRNLITGEPLQICTDLRGPHMVSADSLPPCGPAGTLFEPADDDNSGPVVTRTQLADALAGVLDVLDAATVHERVGDAACRASPRVLRARQLLDQLAAEAQP